MKCVLVFIANFVAGISSLPYMFGFVKRRSAKGSPLGKTR